LLDLCDRMGLLVFNEGFDKWEKTMGLQKPEDEFREVMERNAANWIRRDRNHPSVMLWSMCNENWRQLITPWGREGIEFCVDLYKRLDPTRPVTIGDFRPKELLKDHPGTLEPVDIASWNYNGCYAMSKEVYPEKPVIYSESASSVSTRGYYEIPHPEKMRQWSDTRQVESYDLSGKVDYPDREFYRMERDRYVAGEFVWTGFDYLGEPSPFDKEARSSYYGIVDLCGIPKDRFYLYRSYWNTEDVTVHILPHWNWPERCGKEVPVYVYTSGDEAELFLNGKSLERRKKQAAETGRELLPQGIDAGIVNRYRLRWEEVVYQPGELKAVAYKNGRKIGESVIRTAGEPAGIRLTADRREIAADGDDLCYVKVEMVDKDGNPCPLATNMLHYNVTGPVQLVAVGNGNPIGMDAFTDKQHPLFYGKAMAVLRSMKNSSGAATLDVSGEGVGESSLTIESIYQ